MANRQLKPDVTGSGETLEHLLTRLRSNLPRPVRPWGGQAGWEHFVSSRRPPRGAGGAEAPVPRERPIPDAYAPI
jgi:hypothetical protein